MLTGKCIIYECMASRIDRPVQHQEQEMHEDLIVLNDKRGAGGGGGGGD